MTHFVFETGGHFEPLLAAGFLPHRGSWMLDFVFIAMMAVLPIQALSFYLVRYRKLYRLHRNIQIVTATILLVTIVAFEIDLRLVTDWRELARESSLYESGWVDRLLWIHLAFAIPTPFVWGWTILMALKNFGWKIELNDYAEKHRKWGLASATLMAGTSVTGWAFYIAAFVM